MAKNLCRNFSPPWFSGRWRDWHRGHGCELDDGEPCTPAGAAEIAAGGMVGGEESRWEARADRIHVFPRYGRPHSLAADCWCGTTVTVDGICVHRGMEVSS